MVVDKLVVGEDWEKVIESIAPGSGSDTAGTVWVCIDEQGTVMLFIAADHTGGLLTTVSMKV